MAGMCRDAHVQRSYFMKTWEGAYIFHCTEGKDGSKPFNWILAKLTGGSGDGYSCSEKMISCLRTDKVDDEFPLAHEAMGPMYHKPHDRHIMEKQPIDWKPDAAV